MDTKPCPKCGAQVEQSSAFCPKCGEKTALNVESAPVSAEPVIPAGATTEPAAPGKETISSEEVSGVIVEPTVTSAEPAPSQPVELKCPHCNAPVNEGGVFCSTCGKEIIKPEQGRPINNPALAKPKKMSSKKIIIICIIAAVVVIGGIVSAILISNNIAENKAKEAKIEKERAYKATYLENLKDLQYIATTGTTEMNDLDYLTQLVWYNAIWEESDPDTNKYTKGTKDFDEALEKLFKDKEVIETIETISTYKDKVDSLMDDLRNPPKEYEKYYDAALEVSGAFNEYADMVVNPIGSYNDYSDQSNDSYKALKKLVDKFDTMIPKAGTKEKI